MNTKENINFIFQLNNKRRSSYFFLYFIISGIVAIGASFYFIATNMNTALIATIAAAIVNFICLSKIKPSFFEMLVSDKNIQVNHYSVSSVVRSYQSIELPLNKLKEFHITRSFFGLKKKLIISVDSKFGLADYPYVSISALSKKEMALVFHVLNEIRKNNKKN